MADKIPVTKTMDGSEWLLFDEADVRRACATQGCDREMIEDCVGNMKEGTSDGTCCYISLINDLKIHPEYEFATTSGESKQS